MKKTIPIVVAVLLMLGGSTTLMRAADAAGGDPVISGTGRVGDTLMIASYGSLTGGPDDFTYAWLWEGEEVPGPLDHGATHTVTEADLGHELSVLVKPRRAGAERLASNRILATGSVAAIPDVAIDVAIAGTPKVGRTVSAQIAAGSPGATISIQWLRDGAAIPGATAATYRVVKGDAGRTLSVRATASQTGQASVSRDADARRVAAFNAARPKLTGVAKVGKTLKVTSRGTWHAPGHRFSHQWLRNGSKISRATKSSYKLTAKDRGKPITVVVRATKTGFPIVQAASSRSAKVR